MIFLPRIIFGFIYIYTVRKKIALVCDLLILPPLGNPVCELRHLGVHTSVSAACVAEGDDTGQFTLIKNLVTRPYTDVLEDLWGWGV